MKLTNKTILITGGSAGIGLGLAKALLENGNTVIITGRSRARLEAAKQAHPGLHFFEGDISSEQSLRDMTEFVEKEFPNLDVLINNAGSMFEYEFDSDPDTLKKIDIEVTTNLLAPTKLISLLLPTLKKQADAAIINVTSAMAFIPGKATPLYSGSKAAFHFFTNTLRRQLEHSNIKVFEVFPPSVDTEMTAHQDQPKITVDELVDKALKGISKDQYQIRIGFTKVIYLLSRIAPNLFEALIAKHYDKQVKKLNNSSA